MLQVTVFAVSEKKMEKSPLFLKKGPTFSQGLREGANVRMKLDKFGAWGKSYSFEGGKKSPKSTSLRPHFAVPAVAP